MLIDDWYREQVNRDVCRQFDIPVWVVLGKPRPRFFRVRWMLRRITGWDGDV